MSGSSKERLPRLLAIVGPTGSGKSAAAVKAALRFGGEVVSADSRQIYREMDIGTGKITEKEMRGVPHHLLDAVVPDEALTLADYKTRAMEAVDAVIARGKLPILAGGTGLYVSAIVDNLEIPEVAPDPVRRKALEALSDEALFGKLREEDPHYAMRIGPNRRYAIRALEVIGATGKTFSSQQGSGEAKYDVLLAGLTPPQDVLRDRIRRRVDEMMSRGLLDETKRLMDAYDEGLPALSGIGYRELIGHLRGEMTLREAVEMIKLHTRQYAKRQMTWFKRDKRIEWFSSDKAMMARVENWLK